MTNDLNKKKRSPIGWIITVTGLAAFCIALAAGVITLFVQNNKQKVTLENMYERAFYQTGDALNNIEINLSKLLVSRSKTESAVLANDIYRQAQAAEAAVSELPLEQDTIFNVSKFLNQTGDWCNSYAKELMYARSTENYDVMTEELYITARNVNAAVKELIARFAEGWKVLGGSKGRINIGQIDMDGTLKNNSVEYPELIYDGPFSDAINKRSFMGLEHLEEITCEQAAEKMQHQLGELGVGNLTCVGESTRPEAYEFEGTDNCGAVFMSVSKKGGLLISLSSDKTVGAVTVSEKDAVERALSIASACGFENMTPVWYNMIGAAAYVNLAPEYNGVVCYSDLVKVKVALDDGSVLGLEATGYCTNHHERTFNPTINEKTALSLISDKLTVTGVRLAVVPKDTGEVLCYEIAAEYKGLEYFVYIDAYNGDQVNIMRVMDEDQGRMVM